jgi:hypothetical protein
MKRSFFVVVFVLVAMSAIATDFHLFFNGAGHIVRSRGYDVYGDYRYEVFARAESESVQKLNADYEKFYKVTYLKPTPIIYDNVLGYTLGLYKPIPVGTVLHVTIYDGAVLPVQYVFLIHILSADRMSSVFFKAELKR